MYFCTNFILTFISFRKYAGIEQNCVTFVTNMLDFVKDTIMKLDAMAFKIVLLALQGKKYHRFTRKSSQIQFLFVTCRL